MTKAFSGLRAVVYSLSGYTVWVMADSCTKLAGEARLPASQIIVVSGVFTMLTLFAVTAARGQKHRLIPMQWKREVLRSLLYVALSFINVVAFTRFPLTTVYVALFTSPIIVALFAFLFLRETLSWVQGLAILAGFGGVVLALQPEQAGLPDGDLTGYLSLVLFPVLGAANLVLIRLHGRKEYSESMSFLPQAVRFLVVLPLCLWQFEPMTLATVGSLAGLGFFNAFGVLLVITALKHAPAAIVTPFAYTQIISGALFGYVLWHDIPSANLALGSAIIILSGLYIARHAHRVQLVRAEPV
ncbi:MAG: DMT family transporter [Alphaproteobacteria bacterium]|nr:DMT family transporter [Alphaproteobacteria bacterium]